MCSIQSINIQSAKRKLYQEKKKQRTNPLEIQIMVLGKTFKIILIGILKNKCSDELFWLRTGKYKETSNRYYVK